MKNPINKFLHYHRRRLQLYVTLVQVILVTAALIKLDQDRVMICQPDFEQQTLICVEN
jgi:hypothetical protein